MGPRLAAERPRRSGRTERFGRPVEPTGLGAVEGGGRLVASFLAAGLVDRLYLFVSPQELGRDAVPAFPPPLAPDFMQAWHPAFAPEVLGEDVLTVYERES